MNDAPTRDRLLGLWALVVAIVLGLVFDAAVDNRSEGDPAASVGHQVVSTGPAIVLVAALAVAAAVMFVRTDRTASRSRGALALVASGALYLAGGFVWMVVLDTTTPHRQDAGGLIGCGLLASVTGLIWLTKLWFMRKRPRSVADGWLGRVSERHGPLSYFVFFMVLAVLALSTLAVGTRGPNAAAVAVCLVGAGLWLAVRMLRLAGQALGPGDVRPERPRDAEAARYLAPAGEGRFTRSWRLTRIAFEVVRGDAAMLGLALISVVVNLAATALLLHLAGWLDGHSHRSSFVWWALVFAWPTTFLVTFLNVAIAAAASSRLDGRRMSVRQAFGVSVGRLGQIVVWSLLATGVGVILQQVAERIPFGGRIASFVAGTAWGLVTFFAIPILALEGCTATGCVRRSTRIVRERWGEGIVGTVTISAWVVLVAIPMGLLVGVVAGVAGAGSSAAIVGVILAMIVLGGFATVVRQVFAVALYRYAIDGAVLGGFKQEDLERPFEAKRRWL